MAIGTFIPARAYVREKRNGVGRPIGQYAIQCAPIEDDSLDVRDIRDIFFRLVAARALQVNRYLDIMSVREFIAGTPSCNPRLGYRFSHYHIFGAVVSEPGGIDDRGYPYKRWTLSDRAAAAKAIKHDVRRGLTVGGLAAVRRRGNREPAQDGGQP